MSFCYCGSQPPLWTGGWAASASWGWGAFVRGLGLLWAQRAPGARSQDWAWLTSQGKSLITQQRHSSPKLTGFSSGWRLESRPLSLFSYWLNRRGVQKPSGGWRAWSLCSLCLCIARNPRYRKNVVILFPAEFFCSGVANCLLLKTELEMRKLCLKKGICDLLLSKLALQLCWSMVLEKAGLYLKMGFLRWFWVHGERFDNGYGFCENTNCTINSRTNTDKHNCKHWTWRILYSHAGIIKDTTSEVKHQT